ncbi:MAG: DUF433 domain-containing protein [Thermoplasmatota archaeon]
MSEIVIDEDVRHGKPVIEGTRITVDEVLGMLESSMTFQEIEEEFGLTEKEIRAVIRYVAGVVRGETVRDVPA